MRQHARSAQNCFIGLGSNLGDRGQNLRRALAELEKLSGTKILKVSAFYDTAPVGYREQNRFLNAAAQLETDLTPLELLAKTKAIEKKLGRETSFKWGPRVIDIDILAYGGQIIDAEGLRIPHLELSARRFVLEPLAEIAPDYIDARSQKTYKQLLKLLL
ncbi:MAG: 2-amino-4-hydroxy-6-hydroxymethyldihydropteridine diphosphokinase [Candidatus Margulisbacteria bacterium]|jgi:2-amino-4-hydroxy-6-hydroxymethyldihydropteridine diphosphokinase|nr:2-amino-4-hydroxy-6-hydroxymethyldihydropteridine diphosphokinase [Candidatus Margulisiibacteriota bacterium]